MSRDYRFFLEDIKLACEKIIRYIQSLEEEQFFEDEKTYDAVVRNLTVIGEAVKNIPQEVRNRHPQTEWRKIAGFRDIAVHEYFGIDQEILWDILQNEVPSLLSRIKIILSQEEQESNS